MLHCLLIISSQWSNGNGNFLVYFLSSPCGCVLLTWSIGACTRAPQQILHQSHVPWNVKGHPGLADECHISTSQTSEPCSGDDVRRRQSGGLIYDYSVVFQRAGFFRDGGLGFHFNDPKQRTNFSKSQQAWVNNNHQHQLKTIMDATSLWVGRSVDTAIQWRREWRP